MKEVVRQILVEKSVINFYLHGGASVSIQSDGTFISADLNLDKIKLVSEIETLLLNVTGSVKTLEAVVLSIMNSDKLHDELIAWTADVHHGYFYVEQMSTERK